MPVSYTHLLKLFGNEDVTRVVSTVGPEQEYFLVDKELFNKRSDLKFCGRTMFGAPAPKGQEMDDHYFGALRPRVSAFMKELDEELWKLGIPAKTKHNEVAPAQHELATIYTTTNVAVDNNQLTMEIMKMCIRDSNTIIKKKLLQMVFLVIPITNHESSRKPASVDSFFLVFFKS